MKNDNVYLQFAYLGDCQICKEPVYGTPPKENCDRFNFHPVVHSECYRKKEKIATGGKVVPDTLQGCRYVERPTEI